LLLGGNSQGVVWLKDQVSILIQKVSLARLVYITNKSDSRCKRQDLKNKIKQFLKDFF
jgi:hypothetical protein